MRLLKGEAIVKYPLLALVSLAAVTGCANDVSGLSLSGVPFVEATVNGVRWQVDSAGIFAFVRLSDSLFYINAQHPAVTDGLLLNFRTADTLGSYTLNDVRDPLPIGAFYKYDSPLDTLPRVYATVREHVGSVQLVALDTLQHIATGRFEFDAQELGGTTVLRVRGGAFRVRYRLE